MNTVYGPPACVRDRAELVDRARGPACPHTSTRAPASALRVRSPRVRANGETSRVKCSRVAPSSCASAAQLALGRAVADDQAAAALAQRRVEVAQGLEHELRARARRVAPVEQAVVEAEDRHDPLVLLERRPQRRLVVDAQVAPEPDDRRHRAPPCAAHAPAESR